VTKEAGGVQVRWNYWARDEEREFRFSYRLDGAVSRHDDVAELYLKIVGDAWDRPMGQVVVDLHLPEGNTAPVEAWAHGPLFGDVRILSDHHVQFKVAPLPANTFWEARLLTGTVGTRALVATLLDLARRGYYRISEKRESKQGWFGHTRMETDYLFEATGEKIELLDLEEELVTFVHGLVGRRKAFRISELKRAAKGQTSKLRRWFEKWRRRIGKLARKEGLLEPLPVRPMLLNALCGVVMAAAGGAVSLGTAALRRQTPQGRRLRLAWKAFMTHLKKISRGLGPVSLTSGEWERYLVYAVVFNLHTPLGKVMERSLHGSSRGFFPWFVGAPSGNGGGGAG
jgi:hypothetical protein